MAAAAAAAAAAAEGQVQYRFVPRHGLDEGRSTGRPAVYPLLPGSDAHRGRRALAGPRYVGLLPGEEGGGPPSIKTLEPVSFSGELKVNAPSHISTATFFF